MNATQIIDLIKLQEQELYKDLQECLEKLGVNDPITQEATTRWATIYKLAKTLEA